MTQHSCYLGIDGGGSKTEAVILDDRDKVIGVGLSAGSNVTFTPKRVGVASFVTAISRAMAEASVGPDDITAAGCTFGMSAAAAFDQLGIKAVPRGMSEASVAFERAGILDRVGVVVIAGTGSSCTGRNGRGEHCHCGGWGAVLGDDGSGYHIGRDGIRQVLWAVEGRVSPTLLTEKALEYFSIRSPREMIRTFAGTRVNQTLAAGFAAKVSEAAAEGDEAAISILRNAGREIAELGMFVASRVFQAEDEFPVVLAGGVYNAGEVLVAEIRRPFAERFPLCRVLIPDMKPGEAIARMVRRAHNGEEPIVDRRLFRKCRVPHTASRRRRG